MFLDTVYLSHVNLNPVRPTAREETEVGCLGANLELVPAPRRVKALFFAETARESPTSRPGRSRRGYRAERRFRRPSRPPAAIRPGHECRSIRLPAGGTTEPSDSGFGSATTSWNGRAMPWVQSAGPSTEDSGIFDEDTAPSMIAWFMRNQATPSPARASMASMNQGRPCAACLVRTGNRVGSAAALAGSAKPGTSTARSRDSVTRTVAQGWSSSAGHNELSITLTRPPSVTTDSPVRKTVIGVGRRNQADDAIAVPHCRWSASASTSAVNRLATAPPCRPAKGPAASGVGCQRLGPTGSKMAKVAIS